jgi:hypothetical protein
LKGGEGAEEFWIVWSTQPVPDLEAAREDAFKNEGYLSNVTLARLTRDFMTRNANTSLETTNNPVTQKTVVRATGDLIVKLIRLEHR